MHYITHIIVMQRPFTDLKVPMMKQCRKDNSKQEGLILQVYAHQSSWFKSLTYFQNIVLTGFDRKLFHCGSSLNVNMVWGIFLMSVLWNLDMLHALHSSTDLVSSSCSLSSDQATPLPTLPSKGDVWVTWQMYISVIYNLEGWKWNLRVLLSVKYILLI